MPKPIQIRPISNNVQPSQVSPNLPATTVAANTLPQVSTPSETKSKRLSSPPKDLTSSYQGSVLSEAVDVRELTRTALKFIIYGPNRVGKTTLACQFPKPLLLISFEPGENGGAMSVAAQEGIKFIRVGTIERAIKLAYELEQDTYFKSHVVDTVTAIQDMYLAEILGLRTLPAQLNMGAVTDAQYRERSEKTKSLLQLFSILKANTIFVAQEKDHVKPRDKEEGLSINRFVPSPRVESHYACALGQSAAMWLHDRCDCITRLYIEKEYETRQTTVQIGAEQQTIESIVETGRQIRRLRTSWHVNYAAGFRSPVPENVPEWINNPTYEKIEKVLSGHRLSDKDAHYANATSYLT